MGHNAFQHGFAKQTDDPKIIAAAMAQPGVVLRRAVGTKGAFSEQPELPKDLWKLEAPKAEPVRPKAEGLGKRSVAPKPADDKKERAAILSFEKAKQRRDAAREKEQAEAAAKREKEQVRIERAVAKADDALDHAKAHHEEIVAAIAADQEKLDRRAAAEKKRWDA